MSKANKGKKDDKQKNFRTKSPGPKCFPSSISAAVTAPNEANFVHNAYLRGPPPPGFLQNNDCNPRFRQPFPNRQPGPRGNYNPNFRPRAGFPPGPRKPFNKQHHRANKKEQQEGEDSDASSLCTEEDNTLLSCDVCLEAYDEVKCIPKLLSCHHTFCQPCLSKMAQAKSTIECPTCRNTMDVTQSGGVDKLQTNFYVTQIREALSKKQETTEVVSASGSTSKSEQRAETKTCREHSGQQLTHFCRTCELSVCQSCVKAKHSDNHTTVSLDQFIKEQQREMKRDVEEARERCRAIKSIVVGANERKVKCSQEIDRFFDEIRKAVNRRQQSLKDQLDNVFKKQCYGENSKLPDLEKICESLSSTADKCDNILSNTDIEDLVTYKSKLTSKIITAVALLEDEVEDSKFVCKVESKAKDELFFQIKHFGTISVLDPPPPFIIKLLTPNTMFICNQPSKILLSARLKSNGLFDSDAISVTVKDPDGEQLNCAFRMNEKLIESSTTEYAVELCARRSGSHTITVSYHGMRVPNAEFTVPVRGIDPVSVTPLHGAVRDACSHASHMTVDGEGYALVAFTGNCRVQRHHLVSGALIFTFKISCAAAGNGAEPRQDLDCRHQVEMGSGSYSGSLAVLNPLENTLLIYSGDGEPRGRVNLSVPLDNAGPVSFCFSSRGEVVISACKRHALYVLDACSGQVLRTVGTVMKYSAADGRFNKPMSVCRGANDNLIVADSWNNRVQVFNSQGEFLYKFGQPAVSGGARGGGSEGLKRALCRPAAVETDREGNILVADQGNNCVQVFSRDGDFLVSIESQGSPLGVLKGLKATDIGFCVVLDETNSSLKKYKYM